MLVCPEWRPVDGGFEAFFEHVGPKPTPGHTLERVDNDRGYEPGNVRWATWREQMNNRRNTVRLRVGDVEMTVSQWAERAGISVALIYFRLRRGWAPLDVVGPADYSHDRRRRALALSRLLTIDGVTRHLAEWVEMSPVTLSTIYGRLRRGWDHKRAVFSPIHSALDRGRPRIEVEIERLSS